MRTIAIYNRKGGQMKTTLAYNLAAVKAEADCNVLLVDLDPQASLTIMAGFDPGDARFHALSVTTLLRNGKMPADCCYPIESMGEEIAERLLLLPATYDLATVEIELTRMPDLAAARQCLAARLKAFEDLYDYCLIDCPPHLELLVFNALQASDGVIIPAKPDFLCWKALDSATQAVNAFAAQYKPSLKIFGTVAAMYEKGIRNQRNVYETMQHYTHCLGAVRKSADVSRSDHESIPVVIGNRKCEAAREIRAIADQIK